MRYAVSIKWLNGVSTVTVFTDKDQAQKHAWAMTEFKGCQVFYGTEVLAQSETQPNEQEND